MSIAAAVVPSDKPMSARTSIRALSHGTRRDSLLTAVRTLHDTPDHEDGSASAGVGAHAAAVVSAAMRAPDGGLQSSHEPRAARPFDAHRLAASLRFVLASTAASAQAASAHASALVESLILKEISSFVVL